MKNKNRNTKKIIIPAINQKMGMLKSNIPGILVKHPEFGVFAAYSWIKTVPSNCYRKTGFTNLLSDETQYAKLVTNVIDVVIPNVYKNHEQIFSPAGKWTYPHVHRLENETKHQAKEIAELIHKQKFGEDEDLDWWQIGVTGGTRLIGIYNMADNAFYPIFADWNHLLYPDEKHNMADYSKFSYSPTM